MNSSLMQSTRGNSVMPTFISGFALPAALLIFGIIGKKIATTGFWNWRLQDLDLGIDFAVLGLVSCLLNGFDLYRIERRPLAKFPDVATQKWARDEAVEEQF